MGLKLTPAQFWDIYLDFDFSDPKTRLKSWNLSKDFSTNASEIKKQKKKTVKFKLKYGVCKSSNQLIHVHQ